MTKIDIEYCQFLHVNNSVYVRPWSSDTQGGWKESATKILDPMPEKVKFCFFRNLFCECLFFLETLTYVKKDL